MLDIFVLLYNEQIRHFIVFISARILNRKYQQTILKCYVSRILQLNKFQMFIILKETLLFTSRLYTFLNTKMLIKK